MQKKERAADSVVFYEYKEIMEKQAASNQKTHQPKTQASGCTASAGPNGMTVMPPSYGMDLMDYGFTSTTGSVLQTKLTINEPGDVYEREADQVADQIMRMPQPQLPRKCSCGGTPGPDGECETCKQKRLAIQRKEAVSGGSGMAPTIVQEVLRSPGQPLDSATRAFMEPRFGYNFSQVRVHTGMVAEQSARDVNAHAYTVGQNMVFGPGHFAPGTQEGRQLIAHELTHVMQQSGADKIRSGQTAPELSVTSISGEIMRSDAMFSIGSSQIRSRANLTVARRSARLPQRQTQNRIWTPPGSSSNFRHPRPRRLYPKLPPPGVSPTPDLLNKLPVPQPIIAFGTFAPGRAVLRNVSWGGYLRDFEKEQTTTLDANRPELLSFAILQPPTSVWSEDPGKWGRIDITKETTADGYQVPIVEDLDAVLVVPLNSYTEAVFRLDGKSIKSTRKWGFLRDYEGTYWVPVENVWIEQVQSNEITRSASWEKAQQQRKRQEEERKRQEEERKMLEELAKSFPPFRLPQEPFEPYEDDPRKGTLTPKVTDDVLMFADRRKAVSVDDLITWAENNLSEDVDEQKLLANLEGSSEFIGSTAVRRTAGVTLVVELGKREQAGVGSAAAVKRRGSRRRRKCKRPTGPCPVRHSRLTKRNEYWDLAYNYRRSHQMLEQKDFNQNIAVLLLDGETPIIQKNEMGLHSEQLILWLLVKRGINSDCPIQGLFSERQPCQEICQTQILPQLCRINNGVPYDVFFAIDYYNSPKGMKTENNRHELIKSYAWAGYFGDF